MRCPPDGLREFVLLDCRMEFLQLQQLEGPAEVFAVDVGQPEAALQTANRLSAIHGVRVPDHGAFVARLLPEADLHQVGWKRDSANRLCMRVPPHTVGVGTPVSLLRVVDDLVLLSEDWWVLGLRYAFDQEQRGTVHNLGFQAFAAGHMRCFVVPMSAESSARVLLTTCSANLEPLVAPLPLLDGQEPPALDLLRDAVLFPPLGEWASTLPPLNGDAYQEPDLEAGPDGLFQHQRTTVEWMQRVESEGSSATPLATRDAVRYAERVFYPQGGEHLLKDHLRNERLMEEAAHSPDALAPSGGLLAHPVGSGKTVIAIELVRRGAGEVPTSASAGEAHTAGTLVVCPDHIVAQWVAAFGRFAPELAVVAADGMSCATDPLLHAAAAVVVGYGSLAEFVASAASDCTVTEGDAFGRTLNAEDTVSSSGDHAVRLDQEVPLGYNTEVVKALVGTRWRRLVIDEPQEVIDQLGSYGALIAMQAKYRWTLTATPDECVHEIVSLVWGEPLDRQLFRRVRHTWAEKFARRDPPSRTLPVPPLHSHTVPVVPSWREASVFRFYSEMDWGVDKMVQLCSFFAGKAHVDVAGEGEEGAEEEATQNFASLDEWYSHHHSLHTGQLVKLQSSIDERKLLLGTLEAELNPGEENAYNPVELLDDLFDEDFMGELNPHLDSFSLEFGDEAPAPAADSVNVVQRSPARERAATVGTLRAEVQRLERAADSQRRALHFVTVAADSLHNPRAECAVCYERLQGHEVTVLRCMHVFDRKCVTHMLRFTTALDGSVHANTSQSHVTCPLCRIPTRRREMSTFLHDRPLCDVSPARDTAPSEVGRSRRPGIAQGSADTGMSGAMAHNELDPAMVDQAGSKMAAVVQLVTTLLAENPTDRVLVFAQWPHLLSTVANTLDLAGVENCILLGPAIHRAAALAAFQDECGPRVMLLSFKHHASGLNLHQANHCIMVHPFCCAFAISSHLAEAQAFERQAIGRVRRYPQSKPCHIYRLFMRGTIEEELYSTWGLV